jgi:hypothetical protein
VVQEGKGGLLDEDVVVVGRAAQERRPGDQVAGLEAEPFGEEPLRRGLVGGAEDDVAEPPGPYGVLTQHPGSPRAPALGAAGCVVRRRRGRILGDACLDLDGDGDLGARVDRPERVRAADERYAEPAQCGADAGEVVGVVGTDDQLLQTAAVRVHDPQLLATVGGGEARAAQGGEAEVLVIGRGRPDRR